MIFLNMFEPQLEILYKSGFVIIKKNILAIEQKVNKMKQEGLQPS